MSHHYRLTLEYDGTAFSGWQVQPSARTVEGVLRGAFVAINCSPLRLTAAGRTDAGAHAHGQVVGFSTEREWRGDRLADALNATLPEDVAVVSAAPAPEGFHARFDAERRTYRYMVLAQRRRPAVARRYAWHVGTVLDVPAMRRAGGLLVGTHDFAGFGRSPRAGGTTVRTVHRVVVRSATRPGGDGARAVCIEVTADAFLYGMMRSIAGAVVGVGRGVSPVEAVETLLSAPHEAQRRPAVAPAHGLHQWSVTYPESATGRLVVVRSR